ncbi:MAG: bifunctional demethylmenaquinone methyltransferase/2-methoxy-6-polyprenyl-1,4-benzoquinol methylase UbiE [Bdellovibrio sp.]
MQKQTEKPTVQAEKIRSMFAKVASRYDSANQVLSFGVHHLWRKKLVKLSRAQIGEAVLDCATGTGDLAIEFKKTVGPSGSVIGTDFCAEMLTPAPGKSEKRGLDIRFEQADVTALPYQDQSFDVVSISFGIRNVENPLRGLSEMARVLKPGGRLVVLEFGKANLPVFSQFYNFYSERILPKIGGLVTGQKEAYEYLQKSSAAFPCREEFLSLMDKTGQLKNMRYWSLTGGIAYIYLGEKKI